VGSARSDKYTAKRLPVRDCLKVRKEQFEVNSNVNKQILDNFLELLHYYDHAGHASMVFASDSTPEALEFSQLFHPSPSMLLLQV
jgi:hypothetical protein